ncbi:conserved hypothetical protein [Gammaproteobacteria bacterium]
MSDAMDYPLALRTKRDYVCARCWGLLVIFDAPDHRGYLVKCDNPDCDGNGYVTRHYAEQRRGESFYDLLDAQRNVGEALGLPALTRTKTQDEALKALGF